MAYHHASQPLQLNPERYEMLILGQEILAPYCKGRGKGEDSGRPMFPLTAGNTTRLPFLGYASGAYLGRLVEVIAKQANPPLKLDSIYETDMAEGLKAMALEGHGLAFLPASSVRKEVKARRLVRASAPGEHELTMEVRIYRERPELARHTKPAALALWEFLRAATATGSRRRTGPKT